MFLKKIQAILAVIILLTAADALAWYNGGIPSALATPHPSRLVVKFKPGDLPRMILKKGSAVSTGMVAMDRLNEKFQVMNMAPLPASGKALEKTPLAHILILTPAAGSDLAAMAAAYGALPNVVYAEPEYEVQFYGSPDDSLYPQQWSLHNAGQEHYSILRVDGSYNDQLISVTGLSGADIHADQVFQTPPDNTVAVIVAILDTGVDMAHPDLAADIWTNPNEIPGNGIDDDHNGYVDDVHGWDFGGDGTFGSLGDNDPTDDFGHGTHLAGIVAAVTNNLIGIAGTNPNCRIMPLKIDPLPLTTYISSGIIYAADNGADVINMSFGLVYQSHLIQDALDYARTKGVILCASSGNDFTEKINYPAGFPGVMAVGASTDSDHVASFSTYGSNVAFVAPGDNILSLRAAGTDMYAGSYPQEPGVHIVHSLYYIASGTSMSCPYAVGIASYLRSVSPGLTPDKTRSLLEQTADDIIDPYGVGWNLPGWDKYSGYGRLNLYRALQAVPKIRARIEDPPPNAVLAGALEISGLADGTDFSGFMLDYGEGSEPTLWTNISSSPTPVSGGTLGNWFSSDLSGKYTLRLRVGDDNVSYVTVYLANQITADITFPPPLATLTNTAMVSGSAYCPDFSHYLLEFGAGSEPSAWDTLAVSNIPAYNSELAGWFVDDLTAGDYTLRLSVFSHSGLQSSDFILVHTESIFSGNRGWKADLGDMTTPIANYGDIDHDGDNEIIVGTAGGIKVFNTDGSPQTTGIPTYPPNNYSVPIAVGNLDGDGIDDYVALGYDPPIVYGYPSSAPSFKNYLGILSNISSNLYSEHELTKIFLKDVDDDGLDEINILIYNGNQSKAFVLESDGTIHTVLDHYSVMLPADLNGDGKDELYVGNDQFGMLKQIDYAGGAAVDSIIVQLNGSPFYPSDMSAFDIDGDGQLELILYGYYVDYGYRLYAFDYGFNLLPGWPHDMLIGSFVVPTTPVFGDIDGDGSIEYFSTYFDYSSSYILAWNVDGTPYLPGSPSGLFATVPGLSVLNMLSMADLNGDKIPDLVACAINDIFFTYKVQRIYAWNNRGKILSGFPIISEMGTTTYLRYSPVIGDINKDGHIDLTMTSCDSTLMFVNFPATTYSPCGAPVPMWRYNRSFSAVGRTPDSCDYTDVPAGPGALPQGFTLEQNFPNPFNAVTDIAFSLPTRSSVSIVIYDILGRKVRELLNEERAAGKYIIRWNGANSSGTAVASGLYLYRLKTGDYSQAKKMLLLK